MSTIAARGSPPGVVLSDAEEASSRRIEAEVRVAVGALGRDRLGLVVAGVEPVQAAVGHMREEDRPAGDGVGAPAVLVGARPDVEGREGDVLGSTVGRAHHEHAAAAFGRPALDPVHVVAVDPGSLRRTTAPTRSSIRIGDGQLP